MTKKDIPNILNMVPAEQDNTRVGGLMEDVEVPEGESKWIYGIVTQNCASSESAK